jgi:RHS repeat-associated protein
VDETWEEGSLGAGLHHNVFRWYETGTGRYTRPDPVIPELMPVTLDPWRAMEQAFEHDYAYVGSNPTSYVDPRGLWRGKPGQQSDDAWKSPCQNAAPLSPSDPKACQYGNLRAKPPAGISVFFDWEINCVCKCMGDSPSANCVRGFLQCAHDSGADVTRVEPHIWCRNNCQNKGLWGYNDGKKLTVWSTQLIPMALMAVLWWLAVGWVVRPQQS